MSLPKGILLNAVFILFFVYILLFVSHFYHYPIYFAMSLKLELYHLVPRTCHVSEMWFLILHHGMERDC